jgi:hypothetical protein
LCSQFLKKRLTANETKFLTRHLRNSQLRLIGSYSAGRFGLP